MRAAALTLIVLSSAACAGQPSPAAVATDPNDPGIGHIHGIGVDPADGSVYLAGHHGLFQVRSPQTATRVAERLQDHMGFTVIGPKTFLASGHPAAAEIEAGNPPHLGLIRTTDAGLTWTTVSEAGTADFHSLQPAGHNLFSYDSQTGRVRRSSDDGLTWTKQGAQIQVVDLAGNAAQPDRVYATTPEGLQISRDGGMSFTVVAEAPLMSHVDSLSEDSLIGVGPDGRVHVSTDSGKTWQTRGSLPGLVTAFTAVDSNRVIASVEDGTVLESRNAGTDFSVIYRMAH